MASRQFKGVQSKSSVFRTTYPFTDNPQTVNSNYKGIKRMGTFDTVSNNVVSAINVNADSITSDNIKVYNIVSDSERTIQQLSLPVDDTIIIDPNNNRTFIVTFDTIENSEVSVESTIDVTSEDSQIGDMLIFMFKFSGTNTVRINLTSNYYFTACGETRTYIQLGNYERWVVPFMYDGEKFVNTEDNC